MSRSKLGKGPAAIAGRLAARRDAALRAQDKTWRRETFCLPRAAAREVAQDWFDRYPKAAYMTAIESWRVLDVGTSDERIEFTMRRLPSAD